MPLSQSFRSISAPARNDPLVDFGYNKVPNKLRGCHPLQEFRIGQNSVRPKSEKEARGPPPAPSTAISVAKVEFSLPAGKIYTCSFRSPARKPLRDRFR